MRFDSGIAGKITLGYYFVGAVILALSGFTFFELRQLEEASRSGERVGAFLTAVLQAGRLEKDYLLEGDVEALQTAVQHGKAAARLLDQHPSDFSPVLGPGALAALRADLGGYVDSLQRLAEPGLERRTAEPLPAHGRAVGQDLIGTAEAMVASERRLRQASLGRSRLALLVGVFALVVAGAATARLLSRRVVRPLQQLEISMDSVAAGRLGQVAIDSRDREIVSLTRAFNRVLDELESKHAHLVRSQKLAALGTMLSGVAHELNNPLSNISTSCQILDEEIADPDLAYKRDLLAQIDEQVERARLIVRSLLEFARERPSRKERLVLAEVVEETLRFVRGEIPKGLQLHTEIPADLIVLADKQRLQQAMLNLIKNAAEAAGRGGEIAIGAERAAGAWSQARCAERMDAVEIRIRDSGPGIESHILPRIFDPFFTTKEVGRGSGLGLAIVHEIIEEHQGCILAESEPGRGTVFRIRLPLAPAADKQGGDPRV